MRPRASWAAVHLSLQNPPNVVVQEEQTEKGKGAQAVEGSRTRAGPGVGPSQEALPHPPHPCWLPGPWKPRSPAGTRREKQGPVAHLGSFLGRGQHSAVGTEDHAGLTLLTLEPEQRSQGGQLQGEGPPTTAAEPQLRGPHELRRTGACKQACPRGLCGWESWWVPMGHTEVTKRRICPRLQVGHGSAQVPRLSREWSPGWTRTAPQGSQRGPTPEQMTSNSSPWVLGGLAGH